jgi:MFS family permease
MADDALNDDAPRSRPRIPTFVSDLWQDRAARDTLIAACLALAAYGVDPHAYAPGMPEVQSQLREQPNLETVLLLASVLGTGILLVGGALADTLRSRRLLLGGLAGLLIAQLVVIVIPTGPLFIAARLMAVVCDGIILPFAIASVAMAYEGATRATALGVAYAVMGAAVALPPALLLMFGPAGPFVQAYVVAAIVAAIALAVARRRLPDMPGATPIQRPFVIGTALWAFGVVALTAGIVGFGSGADPVRLFTIGLGVGSLVLYVVWRRRFRASEFAVKVDMRPVTAVLMVGIFLGLGQAAPMMQIPLFFQLILAYSPLLATIAITPFIAALLLTGPISGWLLVRLTPRALIIGGTVLLGVGDVLLGLVVRPGASYLLFIVPFLMVGAGFVVAATVRTAVIFASVPRRLPAMAAALNEASISLGSRIGIVIATVVITEVTVRSYSAGLTGMTSTEVATAVAPLEQLLSGIGTMSKDVLLSGYDHATLVPYAEAYTDGVRIVHLLIGAATITGGIVAGLLVGRSDPLGSVWEHRDERLLPAQPAPELGL